MVVLQKPENMLPRLGSFPCSHLQEKFWETENENNPPIRKNHNVKWEITPEQNEDSLEDSGKVFFLTYPSDVMEFFFFLN